MADVLFNKAQAILTTTIMLDIYGTKKEIIIPLIDSVILSQIAFVDLMKLEPQNED